MKKFIATLFVVALVPLSGCLTDGSVSDVAAPAWRSGYSWAWEITSRSEGYVEVEEDGRSFREEAPTDPQTFSESMEVLNTSTNLEGTPVYLAAYRNSFMTQQPSDCSGVAVPPGVPETEFPCFTYPIAQLLAFRQSDLSALDLDYSYSSECTSTSGGQSACRNAVGDLSKGQDPPYPFLDFPLESGKEWGGPLPTGSDEFDLGLGELEWVLQARVSGMRTVDTPLGKIDAVAVQFRLRPTNADEFERQVRQEIQEDGGQLDSFEFRASIAWNVFYSEEYQHIVRGEYVVSIYLALSGSDEEGQHRIEILATETSESVLTGANLANKPERDLEYIARVLFGEVPVNDPAGNLPDPRRISVSITPSQPAVNAAEPVAANFAAQIGDSTGNFTNLGIRWSLLDYDQRSVDSTSAAVDGAQAAYAPTISEPGAYFVQADIYNAETNQVLASTQIPFEAYYEASHEIPETPVGTQFFGNFLGGTQPIELPVHPGVRLLEATARDVSGVHIAESQLTIRDAIQNLVAQDPEAVSVADFRSVFVDEDPWTMEWEQYQSVLEGAWIDVLIRYGTGPIPVSGGSGGGLWAEALAERGSFWSDALEGRLGDAAPIDGPVRGGPVGLL